MDPKNKMALIAMLIADQESTIVLTNNAHSSAVMYPEKYVGDMYPYGDIVKQKEFKKRCIVSKIVLPARVFAANLLPSPTSRTHQWSNT